MASDARVHTMTPASVIDGIFTRSNSLPGGNP